MLPFLRAFSRSMTRTSTLLMPSWWVGARVFLASRGKASTRKNISVGAPSNDSEEASDPEEPEEASDRGQDAELVARARKGDRLACQALVEKYQKRLYGVVFGMLHNREDALEVTQEAFVKAFGRLKDFQGKSGFYTWIYRIAVNLAIDFRRREWKRSDRTTEYDDAREDPGVEEETFTRGAAPNPERASLNRELGDAIAAAMEQLPEEQRAVLVMREVEGMSYQEMADTMGCSIGTIMSRLHYARKKMQAMLEEYL